MSRVENNLDEYGKRALAPLRHAPPIDPSVLSDEKAKFLLHAENLRKNIIPTRLRPTERKPDTRWVRLSTPIFKTFVISIFVLLLVAGSSFTVYAAQSSLPGEPLYSVKSLSEDIRLILTFSTKDKLDLTLDFTNRRMGEISNLVEAGKSLPEGTSDRYQHELEDALQLATQMDDQQMFIALGQIKKLAEDQGITIEELLISLPNQTSPAIIHLKERLQEQVQLSTIGEKNPQEFRLEIRERAHNRQGLKHAPISDDLESTPAIASVTPMPAQDENGMNQPTEIPGHGNSGNGQGQSTPGNSNGNHGPNPTHTPNP